MNPCGRKTLILEEDRQLDALVSPLRIAILEHLSGSGPRSIADLARALGRTPHSLYYHVRRLAAVGILSASEPKGGARAKAGRREALYALAAERIGIAYRPGSPHVVRSVTRSATAILRRAERAFHRAIRGGDVKRIGQEGDAFVMGREARLSPEGLDELRRRFLQIQALLKRENDRREGRAYLLTAVLTPIGTGESRGPR